MKRRSNRLFDPLSKTAWFLVCALLLLLVAANFESLKNQFASKIFSSASNERPMAGIWPTLSKPWTGDLDEMIERGEIRVLTTFNLGFYFIDQGRPRGVVIEMIELFEKFVKKKLGAPAKNLKIIIIPVRRDQLLPFLVEGYGDIVAAQLRITPKRLKTVDFAEPFTNQNREYVITGPASPGISSLEDLAGKKIIVRKDSSYFESLTKLNIRFRKERKPLIKISPADPRLETEDILQMVQAGLLPMTVADDFLTRLWTRVFDQLYTNENLVISYKGQIAQPIRKNSPRLKALIDEFTANFKYGMNVPNIIIKRYRDNTHWVRPALEREPFHRLQEIEGLFKKYGNQYGFDWLLLASFAFQESGFNQKARSSAGAVGVMQVLPKTAADPNVGIRNIHILENNIHAGTKYLGFIRDRYFSDSDLDSFQQMLFTMAGYNAGPNRINRLRKEAVRHDLDPNRWFNNVELVVSAEVGREPVQYVGNIYKYYAAYKRAFAELEEREKAIKNVSKQ